MKNHFNLLFFLISFFLSSLLHATCVSVYKKSIEVKGGIIAIGSAFNAANTELGCYIEIIPVRSDSEVPFQIPKYNGWTENKGLCKFPIKLNPSTFVLKEVCCDPDGPPPCRFSRDEGARVPFPITHNEISLKK